MSRQEMKNEEYTFSSAAMQCNVRKYRDPVIMGPISEPRIRAMNLVMFKYRLKEILKLREKRY